MKILTVSLMFLMGLFSTLDIIKFSISPAAVPPAGKARYAGCRVSNRPATGLSRNTPAPVVIIRGAKVTRMEETPAGDALALIQQWLQPLYRPDTSADASRPENSRIPLRNTLVNGA